MQHGPQCHPNYLDIPPVIVIIVGEGLPHHTTSMGTHHRVTHTTHSLVPHKLVFHHHRPISMLVSISFNLHYINNFNNLNNWIWLILSLKKTKGRRKGRTNKKVTREKGETPKIKIITLGGMLILTTKIKMLVIAIKTRKNRGRIIIFAWTSLRIMWWFQPLHSQLSPNHVFENGWRNQCLIKAPFPLKVQHLPIEFPLTSATSNTEWPLPSTRICS